MRKIIAIGECGLDIEFQEGNPIKSFPGGRILNAAAMLGRTGHQVEFVGECGTDAIGDIIVDFLSRNNVSTRSIDRYTEGLTPTTFLFDNGGTLFYEQYPQQDFDFVWPTIDEHDIIVFGAFFSISSRTRAKLYELLKYASERGTMIIYLPGFPTQKAPRVTKVMPAIFENLELTDIVISRTGDLRHIFDDNNDTQVYSRHISFYCNNFINIDTESGTINHYNGQNIATIQSNTGDSLLLYNAHVIASIITQIIDNNIYRDSLLNFNFTI